MGDANGFFSTFAPCLCIRRSTVAVAPVWSWWIRVTASSVRKNFGVASSDSEIADLCRQASEWLHRYGGQLEMDFIDESEKRQEKEETDRVLSNIDSLLINS